MKPERQELKTKVLRTVPYVQSLPSPESSLRGHGCRAENSYNFLLCADYTPCDPFDTCGDYDESQFSCYADVLGKKGFCRCGQDAVGMAYVEPRGVQKTNVCIQGQLQPVSKANPENDGSEVCFCKKSECRGNAL